MKKHIFIYLLCIGSPITLHHHVFSMDNKQHENKQTTSWFNVSNWLTILSNKIPSISPVTAPSISPSSHELPHISQQACNLLFAVNTDTLKTLSSGNLFNLVTHADPQEDALNIDNLKLDTADTTPVNQLSDEQRLKVGFALINSLPIDMQREIYSHCYPSTTEMIEFLAKTNPTITKLELTKRITHLPQTIDTVLLHEPEKFQEHQIMESDLNIFRYDNNQTQHILHNKSNFGEKLIHYDGPNSKGDMLFCMQTEPTKITIHSYNIDSKEKKILESFNGSSSKDYYYVKPITDRMIALCADESSAVTGEFKSKKNLFGKFAIQFLCTLYHGENLEQKSLYTFNKSSDYELRIKKILFPYKNSVYIVDNNSRLHHFNPLKRTMKEICMHINDSLSFNVSYPTLAVICSQEACKKYDLYNKLSKITLLNFTEKKLIRDNALPRGQYSHSRDNANTGESPWIEFQLFFKDNKIVVLPHNHKADGYLLTFSKAE